MQEYVTRWERWKTECARVLYGNLPAWDAQKALRFRYTSPATEKGKYLPQWFWDSCFHAMTYRWFDPVMAWEELLSLLEHQVGEASPDSGMIPHMQHMSVSGDEAAQKLFGHPQRSPITQPPLLAVATLLVHEAQPDSEHLKTLYAAIKRYQNWFERRRIDDDGLVVSVHPWEAGWDAAQRWDELFGISPQPLNRAQLADIAVRLKTARHDLMQHILDYHGDAWRLRDAGYFHVKALDFNAIWVADLRAAAKIANLLGEGDEAQRFLARAERAVRSIQQKMLKRVADRLEGYDLMVVSGSEKPGGVDSAAKFALLYGECVEQEDAARLRAEIAGTTGYYATQYPVSTTPTNNPSFDPDEYWRGNVWMSVNWPIYRGLRHYGFDADATTLAEKCLALVDRSGFCEFFNPLTGERGQALGVPCPQNQSWTALVLDMLGTEMQRAGA